VSTEGIVVSTEGIALSTAGIVVSTEGIAPATEGIAVSTGCIALSTEALVITEGIAPLSTEGIAVSTEPINKPVRMLLHVVGNTSAPCGQETAEASCIQATYRLLRVYCLSHFAIVFVTPWQPSCLQKNTNCFSADCNSS
jgi:hypothetical protein